LIFSPTDHVSFDDVVAAADEYLPGLIKFALGKSNVQNGLQTLLRYFQDPLLNKQVRLHILIKYLFLNCLCV